MANTPRLIGRKFGELKVLRRAVIKPGVKYARWECRCSCGVLTVKTSNYLLYHRPTLVPRCRGCAIRARGPRPARKIEAGARYGKWTITRECKPGSDRVFEVKCDCGAMRTMALAGLVRQASHVPSRAGRACPNHCRQAYCRMCGTGYLSIRGGPETCPACIGTDAPMPCCFGCGGPASAGPTGTCSTKCYYSIYLHRHGQDLNARRSDPEVRRTCSRCKVGEVHGRSVLCDGCRAAAVAARAVKAKARPRPVRLDVPCARCARPIKQKPAGRPRKTCDPCREAMKAPAAARDALAVLSGC